MTRVRGGMCATAAQSAGGIVSENIAHAQGLQARGYMGKKGNKRKTRWRVLSIGGEDGVPNEEEGDFRPGPSRQVPEKKTFNEEEYTKITTPRQDVLFKKGYLGRKRPVQEQDRQEVQIAEEAVDCDRPTVVTMTEERPQYVAYVDPSNVAYYYNGEGYEICDPYACNFTVLMGPMPHYAGHGSVPPVLAAIPCQPLPLQPLEWFNPAPIPCVQPSCPRSSTDSQNSGPQSSESPGSPVEYEEVVPCEEDHILYQPSPYVYPGYMFGPPMYSMNGVTIQDRHAQPLPMDVSSVKRRKKKRKRRRNQGLGDDASEESSSYERDAENILNKTVETSQDTESDSKISSESINSTSAQHSPTLNECPQGNLVNGHGPSILDVKILNSNKVATLAPESPIDSHICNDNLTSIERKVYFQQDIENENSVEKTNGEINHGESEICDRLAEDRKVSTDTKCTITSPLYTNNINYSEDESVECQDTIRDDVEIISEIKNCKEFDVKDNCDTTDLKASKMFTNESSDSNSIALSENTSIEEIECKELNQEIHSIKPEVIMCLEANKNLVSVTNEESLGSNQGNEVLLMASELDNNLNFSINPVNNKIDPNTLKYAESLAENVIQEALKECVLTSLRKLNLTETIKMWLYNHKDILCSPDQDSDDDSVDDIEPGPKNVHRNPLPALSPSILLLGEAGTRVAMKYYKDMIIINHSNNLHKINNSIHRDTKFIISKNVNLHSLNEIVMDSLLIEKFGGWFDTLIKDNKFLRNGSMMKINMSLVSDGEIVKKIDIPLDLNRNKLFCDSKILNSSSYKNLETNISEKPENLSDIDEYETEFEIFWDSELNEAQHFARHCADDSDDVTFLCDPSLYVGKYYRLGPPAEVNANSDSDSEDEFYKGKTTCEVSRDNGFEEAIDVIEALNKNVDILNVNCGQTNSGITNNDFGKKSGVNFLDPPNLPFSAKANELHQKSSLIMRHLKEEGPFPCGGICCLLQ